MKRGIWILTAALLAGLAGFIATGSRCECTLSEKRAAHDGQSQLPALDWLRQEFKLTDEQFAKVSERHLAYRPTCEELCARVMASYAKLKKLASVGKQVSPELKAALQEHAHLHMECQSAMFNHLYQTAACLSPDQARLYLDAMVPQVIKIAMEPETTHPGH